MNMEMIVAIVGALITLAMAINAFFLRGIFQDLNDVRIQLATISTRGEGKELRIANLELTQKDLYSKIGINHEKLHKLEGSSLQILQMLRDLDSKGAL